MVCYLRRSKLSQQRIEELLTQNDRLMAEIDRANTLNDYLLRKLAPDTVVIAPQESHAND